MLASGALKDVAPSTPERFAQVIRREDEANATIAAKAGIRSER